MSSRKIYKLIVGLGVLLGALFCCVQNDVRLFFVVTGSMEPVISAKSLVISKKINVDGVEVGKVIIFNDQENKRITAHRIVAFQEDQYITKGDTNTYKDRYLVKPEDILGQVVVVFPIISLVNIFLQLAFLAPAFTLGVLIRRFLLFLVKYGFFCPATAHCTFYRLCLFRRAQKAVSSGQEGLSPG